MNRRFIPGLATAALMILGACGSQAGGPGVLNGTATVSAPQTLGAAVLEVTGSGIESFEGQGGSVAYGAVVNLQSHRYRMVVVGSGPLLFGVRVDNAKGPKPKVLVVSAVDEQNESISASDVKVTLAR